MGLNSISLLQALTDKMRWHQSRQSLLAENVANAETPGYKGRDLKAYSFGDAMGGNLSMASVSSSTASPMTIAISSNGADGFASGQLNNFEVTPEGNGVTLEDEMMKVTSNQMDYQAATTLYTRSIALIRTALGRTA